MAVTYSNNVIVLAASGDEVTNPIRPFLITTDGAVAGITDIDGNTIWEDQSAAASLQLGDSCAKFYGIKRGAGAGKLYVFLKG